MLPEHLQGKKSGSSAEPSPRQILHVSASWLRDRVCSSSCSSSVLWYAASSDVGDEAGEACKPAVGVSGRSPASILDVVLVEVDVSHQAL